MTDYDTAHPVFDPNRLYLETPAINQLSDTLKRWLWIGATGGVILGASRAGKSTALRTLASRLVTRDGTPIPVAYIQTPSRDQRTIMSIFRALCWGAELRVQPRDTADHLSDRFLHYLADRACDAQCHQTVLFVDEMQRLVPTQFQAFAELHDKLWWLGIRLTVIFVGNDQESDDLLQTVTTRDYAHIRGRFFTRTASFQGLTSKADVEACLAQYDTLRYPTGGPTYVEYFLPEAVKSGWRLASLSRDFWRKFQEYNKTYQIGAWGMQYFTATANTLLTDFLPVYGVDQFEDEMLEQCIEMSGLVPSLVKAAT